LLGEHGYVEIKRVVHGLPLKSELAHYNIEKEQYKQSIDVTSTVCTLFWFFYISRPKSGPEFRVHRGTQTQEYPYLQLIVYPV